MKSRNANNCAFGMLLICYLFTPGVTQAHIENTVIAHYDLSSGKNSHYEILVSKPGKQATVTVVPLGMSNITPSVFKISTCTNRISGLSKQGEYRFSTAETDKNDVLLSNIGYFVNEQNLRGWWIHINSDQTLMFNQDIGELIVSDPKSFIISTEKCHAD